MDPTPLHDNANADVLALMPRDAKRVIDHTLDGDAVGTDPEDAVTNATVFQWIVRATPA